MQQQVEIRTKRPAQYLRGNITKGYFPMDNQHKWYLLCLGYAGGGRKVSLASVTDYSETNKNKLIARLKSFAKSQRYVIKFTTIK